MDNAIAAPVHTIVVGVFQDTASTVPQLRICDNPVTAINKSASSAREVFETGAKSTESDESTGMGAAIGAAAGGAAGLAIAASILTPFGPVIAGGAWPPGLPASAPEQRPAPLLVRSSDSEYRNKTLNGMKPRCGPAARSSPFTMPTSVRTIRDRSFAITAERSRAIPFSAYGTVCPPRRIETDCMATSRAASIAWRGGRSLRRAEPRKPPGAVIRLFGEPSGVSRRVLSLPDALRRSARQAERSARQASVRLAKKAFGSQASARLAFRGRSARLVCRRVELKVLRCKTGSLQVLQHID